MDKKTVKCLITMLWVVIGLSACGGGGGGSAAPPVAGSPTTPTTEDPGWLIPVDRVVDGGPGKDGIPSVDNPVYIAGDSANLTDGELVIGFLDADGARAIPHDIIDWHEVVNDRLDDVPVVINYCPLTGSSMMWRASGGATDPTFGVSGLLFNSNLILYDRETDSNWSQMEVQSVQGARRSERPEMVQILETTWGTWRAMFPQTRVLSRTTGFSRDYDRYPYGSFRTSDELLFAVTPRDRRLQEKVRVVGVRGETTSRAYIISGFANGVSVWNDTLDEMPIVVIGSAGGNFGVTYSRLAADGAVLSFTAMDDTLPNVMQDEDGNTWDVFGTAVAGERTGEVLPRTHSYIAYWFAWAAFNEGTEIDSR